MLLRRRATPLGLRHSLLATRRESNSSSSSLPTRAVSPAPCSASKRLSTEDGRNATQARTRPPMPLRSCAPRSCISKRLPSIFRVVSAITTVFGSAIPCRRAARFGVLANHRLLLCRTRWAAVHPSRIRPAARSPTCYGDQCLGAQSLGSNDLLSIDPEALTA